MNAGAGNAGANAEGAEATQKAQKNTENGFGLGVEGLALCCCLACIAAQSLPIESPTFPIPLCGGVRRRRGGGGGGG